MFKPLSYIQRLDEEKSKITNKLGITLFHIPYWWDKKLPSLKATIATVRPDVLSNTLLENNEKPIPAKPPLVIKRLKTSIQSKLMLATNWNKDDDPTGWYKF